ncbi:SDR family NAD(P)-dependent oxidoreductase [Nocardia anaemiae]|uniref:SDR family NAD(P)-dependent oxidoreductase n=1 Tax=Nocardia anaemiae TaxID=263910 RepID=UPI0007A48B59|nr:SDR family NAD(P)-dependent oxidoreductase [Nocardia anaemiae]
MRTYVITGGTDGMGKGLGLHFLGRGDRVLAVASGAVKGARFLREAAELGAADRASFIQADLSTLAGMHQVIAEVAAVTETVDGVVFGAQNFRSARQETADGFEYTFALAYLSRYVIGHGLFDALERAEAPVIMNIAGSGGLPGTIEWDDLQLRTGYRGMRAAMQSSRCIDLLGVAFSQRHPGARTRYVLYNPLMVRTAMADSLPTAHRILTKTWLRLAGQPVHKAIVPIAELIDHPPTEPLAAYRRRTRLALAGKDFDPESARRLDAITAELVDSRVTGR